MNAWTRRRFLGSALVAAAAAACSPAAAPEPAAPGVGSAGSAAWEQEWEALLKAARAEGTLSVVTVLGQGYRTALDEVERILGLTIEHTALNATQFAPRALQEAEAGIYSYDVMTSSHTTAAPSLYKNGRMDPVRPVIFRPDVLDDSVWRDGFEAGFLDEEKRWMYSPFEIVLRSLWVNTDLVKPDEIKSVEDLLNPKWKGKIIGGDPRNAGSGGNPASALRKAYGDDIIRRLWKDQEVVLSRNSRQSTEQMVRGSYPIGIGAVDETILAEFVAAGQGKNLKAIDIPNINVVNGGGDAIYLFGRAPHPNAAKLFINWYLTQEGQALWSKAALNNSRRKDVPPGNPDGVPVAGRSYINMHDWRNQHLVSETYELASRILN